MSDTWKRWEGQIVDGKFPLIRYLGGSERTAVFLTERRDGERPAKAAIKLAHADVQNSEVQLSRWQEAARLSHPHLIPIYEMGRFEFDGGFFAYVVMECAEENLAQVLRDRALTIVESRAMLDAILDVLAYLHGKGFVHGRIQPANIMASGDQLKVSSDSVRRAGDPLGGPVDQTPYDPPEIARGVVHVPQTFSPAGDIWSLGMTLVETLTQSLPDVRTGEQLDPVIPQSLQEPYLDIARHCLLRRPEGRWSVGQIVARLDGNAPASPARTLSPKPRAPVGAQPRIFRQSRPSAKLYGYVAPIAIGFALLLAAILAGPRLLRDHAEAPQVPVGGGEEPAVPSPSSQAAPLPHEPPTDARKKSLAEEERPSEAPAPMPALARPATIHEEETNTTARSPIGAPVHGEVAHKAMPEVLESARNTIRGTVRVSVKVDVDRSGNVEGAELESAGPSKYFARAALAAAQRWTFTPPRVGGQGVLSSWTLQFEFTRDETKIVPVQKMP
jgi:TonB family protein